MIQDAGSRIHDAGQEAEFKSWNIMPDCQGNLFKIL